MALRTRDGTRLLRHHPTCGVAAIAIVFVACTGEIASPSAVGTSTQTVTCEEHVKPLLLGYCGACHANAVPKGDLRVDEYAALAEDDFAAAETIVSSVVARAMPPRGLPEPTESERTLLQRWKALGFPRGTPATPSSELPPVVTYDEHIRPLFGRHCISCHNANERFGRIRLDTYDDPESTESFWARYRRVHGQIVYRTMPPESAGTKLTRYEVDLFNRWVEQGYKRNQSDGTAFDHAACRVDAPELRLRPRSNAYLANTLAIVFFSGVSDGSVSPTAASRFGELRQALLQLPEHFESLGLGGLGLRVEKTREQSLVGLLDDVAHWATENGGEVLTARFPCVASSSGSVAERKACVSIALSTIMLQAWVLPPRTEDLDALLASYEALAPDGAGPEKHWEGLRAVLLAAFLSPEFLLHVPRGRSMHERDSDSLLKSLVVAQRLGHMLFDSTPTSKLLALAQDPMRPLLSSRGIVAAIESVLDDRLPGPSAESSDSLVALRLRSFADAWLKLRGLPAPAKVDADLSPDQLANLQGDAAEEMRSLLPNLLLEHGATVRDLFTTRRSLLREGSGLEPIYGVSASEGWIELPAARSGILTRAALAMTNEAEPIPVYRGARIAREMLCENFEFPSPEALAVLGAADPREEGDPSWLAMKDALSDRELWEIKTGSTECAVCHNRLNGIGFALADLDSLGRLRDEEVRVGQAGQELRFTIDAATELVFDGSRTARVRGSSELSRAIGESVSAELCFMQSLGSFTRGYAYDRADACLVEVLRASRTTSSGGIITDFAELLAAQVLREVTAP